MSCLDIPYVENGHERQKLNLFLPEKKSATPLPLIITTHGGGWLGGFRGSRPEFGADLLMRGYACTSLGYRLSGDAPFPAQIEDCKAAIRWLRAHAKEYNLDPDRFAVVGHSAGGHLAALLGATAGVGGFDVGGHLDQSSRVQAVVDYSGPTDIVKLIESKAVGSSAGSQLIGGPLARKRAVAGRANPITYLGKGAPPYLIIHGDQDSVVPVNQSELLFEALKKAGMSARLHVIRDAGHDDMFDPEITEMQNAFLERILEGKPDRDALPEAVRTESKFARKPAPPKTSAS